MGLDVELDKQIESMGGRVVQLAVDSVTKVEPEFLTLASAVAQTKVVRL